MEAAQHGSRVHAARAFASFSLRSWIQALADGKAFLPDGFDPARQVIARISRMRSAAD
jgi:hypothetical protein